jgi:3-oxoacyl-[acyl-carrier protein] reductase
MSRLLDGKIVIVTGASSGIGKAIAIRFASEGAKTVVAARDKSRCDEVVSLILGMGYESHAASCDVTSERDIAQLFDETVSKYDGIDVVVANAGISGGNKKVEDYSLEEWNRVLNTNLTGVFLTVREAFRRMKKRGGHVLVMSSQAGVEGYAGKGAYCASKFGVRGLAHALGEEGRQFNINVSAICPGTVATPILAASNTKVKHPMTPEAVAELALYLACLGGNSHIRDVVLERMLQD